jgi:hypothetical protein
MSDLILQSLAMANNCYWTEQTQRAFNIWKTAAEIAPELPLVGYVGELLTEKRTDLREFFGVDWRGQSLDGQSIEVFCDQGMGDILNLIRYFIVMKERWDCKIVLNDYSYYHALEPLLKDLWYIDEFTNEHKMCDYHTNIFSVPAILMGLDVYYPGKLSELLDTPIPEQPAFQVEPREIEGPAIGVAWNSNLDNPLGKMKSVDVEMFRDFPETLYSLIPAKADFIQETPIETLEDTARTIQAMDLVISVDTVVLHLAGIMRKPTYGLLAAGADPRWGNGERTAWYPSVRLFRQEEAGDWSKPMKAIADCVTSTPA